MKRRSFLTGATAGSALSLLDWLGYFRRYGVPGTSKSLGFAEAAADEAVNPRFLIYWFQEGGWDSYSLFSPLDTPNHSSLSSLPAKPLRAQPPSRGHRSWYRRY